MKTAFLLLALQLAATGRAWSAAPKASIEYVEGSWINDPETGKRERRWVGLGTVQSVVVDPRESWVLDFTLSSGQTRYVVFYGYDAGSRGMEFVEAPGRALLFKDVVTEGVSGNAKIVQDGTFASIVGALGRGSHDEYHGDETGRVYAPSINVQLATGGQSGVMIDEMMEARLKQQAAAAKAARQAAKPAPAMWPLLKTLMGQLPLP